VLALLYDFLRQLPVSRAQNPAASLLEETALKLLSKRQRADTAGASTVGTSNPRNPRHCGSIEGRRNRRSYV